MKYYTEADIEKAIYKEIDNLFDEINKEIKSKIESGDRNV